MSMDDQFRFPESRTTPSRVQRVSTPPSTRENRLSRLRNAFTARPGDAPLYSNQVIYTKDAQRVLRAIRQLSDRQRGQVISSPYFYNNRLLTCGNTSQTPRPAGVARPDEHFYHDHRIIKQEKIELQSQVQIRHPLPSEMDFAVHSTDCTIHSSQKSVSCKRLHSSTAPKDASEICGIQQRILTNKKRREEHNKGNVSVDTCMGKTPVVVSQPSKETEPLSTMRATNDPNKALQQSTISQYYRERKTTHNITTTRKEPAAVNDRARDPNKSGDESSSEYVLKSVQSMKESERTLLQANLREAEEVACSIIYNDGSSLLRPKKAQDPTEFGLVFPWSASIEILPISTETGRKTSENKRLLFVRFPLKINRQTDRTLFDWCRNLLRELMISKARIICYDCQFVMRILLEKYELDNKEACLQWVCLDPRIAAWLLSPDNPPKSYSGLLEMSGQKLTENEEMDDASLFCRDVVSLGPAMTHLFHKLKCYNMWELFLEVEMKLCPILAVLETSGIHVDKEALLCGSDILKKKIQKVESETHKLAGHPFLINSPQQLRQVLFEELKLNQKCSKKLARTNIMNFKSTSEAVLQRLQEFHPLPKLVLEYRQLVKLRSTYFDGILAHVRQGMLCTNWDHTAAATGRLTSLNPNMQAIPKQPIIISGVKKQYVIGKEEQDVTLVPRDFYRTQAGWSFLAADFQSIELRLLAHLSEDPSLLQIFHSPGCSDVFISLTCQWLGLKPDEVKVQDRERTKRIVYSVIYGVGRERLADTLGVTPDEAKGFMSSFLGKFPGISAFSRRCIDYCRREGYISTILKRRRWFQHIKAMEFGLRSQAERQAVNFVVQGSAADICKAGMIKVVQAISEDPNCHARLLLQIHDELLLEAPDDEIPRLKGSLKSILETTENLLNNNVKLQVPLKVALSVGKTWGQLKTCDE